MFVFPSPDRFVVGTMGLPGQRTFFLQARDGARVISVSLEKVQVAVLADRLGSLVEEFERRGLSEGEAVPALPDLDPLDEPINEAFRATSLTLGWDAARQRFIVEARETAVLDDEDVDDEAIEEDEGADEVAGALAEMADELTAREASSERAADPRVFGFGTADVEHDHDHEHHHDDDEAVFQVALTADSARSFVERAMRVVGSGRPPCPLCGAPLDATGHICPRSNGHYVN